MDHRLSMAVLSNAVFLRLQFFDGTRLLLRFTCRAVKRSVDSLNMITMLIRSYDTLFWDAASMPKWRFTLDDVSKFVRIALQKDVTKAPVFSQVTHIGGSLEDDLGCLSAVDWPSLLELDFNFDEYDDPVVVTLDSFPHFALLESFRCSVIRQTLDLRGLSRLTRLRELHLRACFCDLAALATCTTLQSLSLVGIAKPTISFGTIANLPFLRHLCIHTAPIGGIRELWGTTSLQSLELLGLPRGSLKLSSLCGITTLHALTVDACDGVQGLELLTSLRSLVLHDPRQSSSHEFFSLTALTSLSSLTLAHMEHREYQLSSLPWLPQVRSFCLLAYEFDVKDVAQAFPSLASLGHIAARLTNNFDTCLDAEYFLPLLTDRSVLSLVEIDHFDFADIYY